MHPHTALDPGTLYLTLCVVILAARLFGELASRLGMPSVLGEMLAGVVIGPSVLGLVPPGEILNFLAELGIMLFIFGIGLETELALLARAGRAAALVALAGVALPMALVYPAMTALGAPPLAALFGAGTMAATSIGVTVRVLNDLGCAQTRAAQVVVGAAVLDDVLGVVLLALIYDFGNGGGVSLWPCLKVMAAVAVVLGLAPLISGQLTLALQYLRQRRQVPGLLPAIHVAALLLLAWASRKLGVPEILGAFAAGLLIAGNAAFPGSRARLQPAFVELLQDRIRPVMQLLTPIFFVNVGLAVDLRILDWSQGTFWAVGMTVLACAVVGKLGAGILASGLSMGERLVVGTAMIPRAEVGLIFAEIGRRAGAFDPPTHAALLFVVILTTLLPPLALKAIVPRCRL